MINIAKKHWNNLQSYRSDRLRCKNYAYGRQYLDIVDFYGKRMTEEEYIRSEGNVPLKNNLIRRILRNVLGVFRNNMQIPAPEALGLDENNPADGILIEKMEQAFFRNNMKEVFARMMEEFLIGGLAAVRKGFRLHEGKYEVTTDPVRPEGFFFNVDASDPRGDDIHTIGEIHSVTLDEAVAAFASSPDDIRRLESFCGSDSAGRENPSAGEKIEIIEMWRLEQRRHWICHDRERGLIFKSDSRPIGSELHTQWATEPVWRYYFIAPDGSILKEGESPYGEAGHPYVFKAYPFIDGEIHSFVADCIDQQRYINRLITLNDWILRSSAKGVLMFPEGAFPSNLDIREVSEMWSRYNGVITYKHQDGVPAPYQVNSNVSNSGITDLITLQLKMMEDVTGVNSALQGQLSGSAVSGTLFEMQTRQALTGLADILEGYNDFIRSCAIKEMRMIKAFEMD